jgi:release factor glutamine methyltransferase
VGVSQNTKLPAAQGVILAEKARRPSRRSDGRGPGGAQPTAAEPCTETKPFPIVWSLDRSCDVGRALLAASRRLREAGSDTPQLDSAVLLAHVLGVSKTWLYAHPHRPLTEEEITRFEELVRRRMCHEPVAYLVGYKSFYGLDISVDRRVLIPRPETEVLVERVLAYVRYLISQGYTPRIADVGTGSGAIAVALAVNAPGVIIYATDISEDALAVAAQNVWRYGLGEQVQLLPGHLIEPLPEPVDIIVANLPYVASQALAELPPQVRDYEPMLALDGGAEGLGVLTAFFELLRAPEGRAKLRPGARIYLEIGADQGSAARNLAQTAFPEADVEVLVDYSGLDRVLVVSLPGG